MLSPGKKRESLAGKLLLSSALVAVSLAYGWWQRHDVQRPSLAMAPPPLAPKKLASIPPGPAIEPSAQSQPATSHADAGAEPTSTQAAAPPKPSAAAKSVRQAIAPPVVSSVPPQNADAVSPSPVPQALPQIATPTGDAAPPLFLVTGTPGPAAKSPAPAGAHLEDGDYVSSRHILMWGEIRVKIFVRGGLITGVQTTEFPDHRSQSLYLSQLAIPKLESEVIANQTAQVDTVSSATDTSYVFQDAVADAIIKATRG